MRNSWVAVAQRHLEREIRKILRDDYAIEVDSEMPIRYYLDFKNNERLIELKEALDRIERGKFGVCLSCGGPIELVLLKSSPGDRFCSSCLDSMHFSRGRHHDGHAHLEMTFTHQF